MIAVVLTRLIFLYTLGMPRADDESRVRLLFPSSLEMVAHPQAHALRRALSSPSDSLEDAQLATITTDTGAFARGPHDYSRYTTLDLCLAATGRARLAVERSLGSQLERDTVPNDTVSVAAAARVARTCGARFTLATTPAAQLPRLFTLAVLERNEPLASAVLSALIARVPAQRDASWASTQWAAAQQVYFSYRWLAPAETLLRTVDAQGPNAWRGQLLVHDAWAQYVSGASDGADTARTRHESEQVIAIATRPTTPLTPEVFALELRAWRTLAMLAALWAPDSLPALAARAQHAFARYATVAPKAFDSETQQLIARATTADRTAVVQAIVPEWFADIQRTLRQSDPPVAPRVQADYWFPAPGRPSSDTLRPVLGKVSVICQNGEINNRADQNFTTQQHFAPLVRRWLDQYGAAGLDITVIHPASGYVQAKTNDMSDRLTWYQNSEEEAQAWRKYVQNYEHLPVLVAVQTRHSNWLPAPDGRRLQMSDIPFWSSVQPGAQHIDEEHESRCAVMDRGGRVLYIGDAYDKFQVGMVLWYLFRTPGGQRVLAQDSAAVSRASR